jgi:hypothetical protein
VRILVTGSRTWDDGYAIITALLDCQPPDSRAIPVVIHGNAEGADRLADDLARELGWGVEPHPADWKRYGKSAGPRRNAEMVALGADVCLAFIKGGSRGAANCADLAEKAGIKTLRFTA